jgi:hypothetical protein
LSSPTATSPPDRPPLEHPTLGRSSPDEPTPSLDRQLASVARRARVQRAIVALPPLGAGLGAGLVCVFLARDLGALREREALGAAGLAALATLGLVALAALRPIDPLSLAALLDRALALRGRLANALSLAADPSQMAALARRDAERHAARIEPARVLPYAWPRSLAGAALLLVAALALLGLGPLRTRPPGVTRAEEAPRLEVADAPAAVDPDALAALRERMAQTRSEGELAPEIEAANDALNTLIEELARGELTEDEALARIAELEATLDRGAPARAAEIQRELAEAAREMREAPSTEALARALADGELDRAAEELSSLAQRARTEPPPRELLENLRAMAADREREAREQALEEAEQEEERLLQRRREREQRGEEQPEQEERLLEQRQRELDRLRREHEARQEVERQLDELRRELGDAADRMEEEHRRPSEGASEAMERAAEELRQQARDQQSAEQMQELARELQRLREALREAQQQQGGEGQSGQGQGQDEGQDGQQGGQGARMRRFVLRAGGGEGGEGMRLGVRRPGGPSGEGGEDQGQGGGQAGQEEGQGAEGQGGDQAGGQGGQGQGEQGEVLMLGQGGDAVLEIPGLGQAGGQGAPQGGGQGEGQEGPGQGTGHDATMRRRGAHVPLRGRPRAARGRARAWARRCWCAPWRRPCASQFSRIQFTPDLMPADILGTTVITEDEHGGSEALEFRKGPIFANVVLADEVNRATPKTQSALLEVMQEHAVTIGGKTHRLEQPYFVLATQNPLEMEGTYPLPEAQLDRFLFKLEVKFPSHAALHAILDRTTGSELPVVNAGARKGRGALDARARPRRARARAREGARHPRARGHAPRSPERRPSA